MAAFTSSGHCKSGDAQLIDFRNLGYGVDGKQARQTDIDVGSWPIPAEVTLAAFGGTSAGVTVCSVTGCF